MPARARRRGREPGPEPRRLVGIRSNGHGDNTVFIDRFLKHFGMTMEPADACPVGWIEAKLNDLAARRKPRLNDLREYCDPLPCGRRDQCRTICRRTPFNDICEP